MNFFKSGAVSGYSLGGRVKYIFFPRFVHLLADFYEIR